jgi:magnesium chelatase family protein
MPFATARTVSLQGAFGHLIDVQTDVSPGQVGITVVGRVDMTINEAKDRCRMALLNSGLGWPSTRRVTILLSPADLPKTGTHFDLAVAVSVLAASGGLPRSELQSTAFIGELTLDGGLRAVGGVLPMTLAAAERGVRRVFVPEPQAREAEMVPDMEVVGVRSLAQAVAVLRGELVPDAAPVSPLTGARLLSWRGEDRLDELDMADLLGMPDARYAVEVAAAGAHHVMLTGPKGAGKTSLAERVPSILPDLTPTESVEASAIHSLAGTLDPERGMIVRPPYSAPHHDASKASLIGGGSGQVKPGEISRAHCGVLFLDEFPLFHADVIEALRQPLESGDVRIARRDEMVTLPARALVVIACNPCPCGDYVADAPGANSCQCREPVRRDYRRKITGPLADRIDIVRELRPHATRPDPLEPPESSATVRARVEAARRRQQERYAGLGWRLNGHAPGPALRDRWPLASAAVAELEDAVLAGKLTRRGATRVHRVAWTVADLRGVDRPGSFELDVALRLRRSEPLMLDMLQGVAG